jgi:hypothetical protein
VVWDVYFVHLVIPLVLLLRLAQVSPGYRPPLLISLIFLALQRYGRYILIYTASPLVMVCGLSSVIVLWLVFLHLRKQTINPPDGSGSELRASPDRVGALSSETG